MLLTLNGFLLAAKEQNRIPLTIFDFTPPPHSSEALIQTPCQRYNTAYAVSRGYEVV